MKPCKKNITEQLNYFTQQDDDWMQYAYDLALHAKKIGEVPVGAVLVFNQQVIGEGFNQSISNQDPCAHAEIQALRFGAQTLGNYRLLGATLYVTLEPCLMCAGAMVHARIQKLIFGARDLKSGAITSQFKALDQPFLNHKVQYAHGLLATPCGNLLSDFFRERRQK